MERAKFAKLIIDSLSTVQQTKLISAEIKNALERETDESEMLLAAMRKINSYFSGEFNLVDYNISYAQDLLQLCLNQRKELKELEVLIANQASQRTILKIKREQEKELRSARLDDLPNSYKQLSRQTSLTITENTVEGAESSQKENLEFDDKVEKIHAKYRKLYELVEDEVADLQVSESYGLNYLARYQQLKTIYNSRVLNLYETLKNVYIGLKWIYRFLKLDEIPEPRPNYFLYDSYNWFLDAVSKVNAQHSKITNMTKICRMAEYWPNALENIKNHGKTEWPGAFTLNEHIYLNSFSIVIIDSDTESKRDIWKLKFNLKLIDLEDRDADIKDSVPLAEWREMLNKEKALEYFTEATNNLSDTNLIQFEPINFRNIDSNKLELGELYIGGSVNKKNTNTIKDVLIILKGFTFKG